MINTAQADRLVVASPAYLARRGVPNNPPDLLEHDGIIYGQSVGGQEWLFRRGTSEISVHLKARLMLSAAEGVREAVLNGQGFAISSRWILVPELASGEVVPVLEEWSLPPMDLWVIYPSRRLNSAKARAFVKWFEEIIGRVTLTRYPHRRGWIYRSSVSTDSPFEDLPIPMRKKPSPSVAIDSGSWRNSYDWCN